MQNSNVPFAPTSGLEVHVSVSIDFFRLGFVDEASWKIAVFNETIQAYLAVGFVVRYLLGYKGIRHGLCAKENLRLQADMMV